MFENSLNADFSSMANKNRVAIYCRCSSDKQEDALDVQVAQSQEIANNKGWNIIDTYVEIKSGTKKENRNEYLRMMEDMKHEKFDIVMIKSLDRLTRNLRDWLSFLDALHKNGAALYTYIDGKFFEPLTCYFVYTIMSMMNEQFSVELSKKIKNSHKIRQKNKTGWNFSKTPFGWNKINQHDYEINEEQAYYIRRAIELIKEGHGFYNISNQLYVEGLRNTKNKKMDSSVIAKIIRSERLYGCVVMHKNESYFMDDKRKSMPEEEWIYVEDALPAIITKEEWLEVQTILESRKSEKNTFIPKKYPLSGKIVCGACGRNYHRHTYDKRCKGEKVEKIPYWKCETSYKNGKAIREKAPEIVCDNESVDEKKLYQVIDEAAESYFKSLYAKKNEIINNVLFYIQKVISKRNSMGSLKSNKKELELWKNRKKNLLNKLADGLITDEEFSIPKKDYDFNISSLEKKIAVLEHESGGLIKNEERLKKIRDCLTETDIIEKCKSMRCVDMIIKIVVNGNGTINVHWNKYKVLGLIELNGLGIGNDAFDEDFITTVNYSGQYCLKDKVNSQKQAILEIIKTNPKASQSELARLIGNGCTKNEVTSRLRFLMKDGIIVKETDGNLVQVKPFNAERSTDKD